MAAVLRMQKKSGLLSDDPIQRIISLLKRSGLPVDIPDYISKEDLISKMHTDKKTRKHTVRFVFLEDIGKVKKNNDEYSFPISDTDLESLIS